MSLLRLLPSVDDLLKYPALQSVAGRYSREQLVAAVREALVSARARILAGGSEEELSPLVKPDRLLAAALALLDSWYAPHFRRVVNAAGVVVHTNLGRSVLCEEAVQAAAEAARHYSNLEYDLETGERGSRHDHVEGLLCRLTGAGAAMAVNNNAAAVLLILSGLAAGREVVVSRGQLVEIGGSFRIPDIMRLSGARLVEVGTTNRTRLSDYEDALGDETGLLLRVHTSNFKIVGYASETSIEELCRLGAGFGVPVVDDLGSGALAPLEVFEQEPSVTQSLEAGCACVCFSGDKLLGGPQAGIIVGETEVVETLKSHPLARAIRLDKMTLAALEATLLLYQDPELAVASIPTLRFLSRSAEETAWLAEAIASALPPDCLAAAEVQVEPSWARPGGGSLPLVQIPSHAVAVRPRDISAEELATRLRRAEVAVIGRVAQDAVHLDVLAVAEDEVPLVVDALRSALAASPPG